MPTGTDRRSFARHQVHAAIGIDTEARKNRVGVTRNVSAGGVLFHSASRFEVGQRLDLYFRARPILREEMHVRGRVVRVWHEARDHYTLFPHVIAVEFEHPLTHFGDSTNIRMG
jgi:hypothetical protein